jgi:hypothetical protein
MINKYTMCFQKINIITRNFVAANSCHSHSNQRSWINERGACRGSTGRLDSTGNLICKRWNRYVCVIGKIIVKIQLIYKMSFANST